MAAKSKSVSKKQTKAYVESQAAAARPIETSDMVCVDCVFRNDYRSAICEQFPNCKPLKVIEGGECNEYKKE